MTKKKQEEEEVISEIKGEPFEAVVGVSADLPRHALLGLFPALYDLLENEKLSPKTVKC